ncbi:Hypothetical_protein [Hexamita inflata]|uniref:Hypothetical_protein n=1 Tax=Hexamita inflata TaxID=28002 RepID=A0AA86PZ69_9EUKA|nr:Hypothetical protein HINF_LOCUS35698 [Hexamita inflata]
MLRVALQYLTLEQQLERTGSYETRSCNLCLRLVELHKHEFRSAIIQRSSILRLRLKRSFQPKYNHQYGPCRVNRVRQSKRFPECPAIDDHLYIEQPLRKHQRRDKFGEQQRIGIEGNIQRQLIHWNAVNQRIIWLVRRYDFEQFRQANRHNSEGANDGQANTDSESVLLVFSNYYCISYQNETPQPLIQTIPGILNDYPQNQFSDIVSAKIITIPKTVNKSAGSFIEYINEYYYMQVIRNELTIHISLSSTVITTLSRYQYQNKNNCFPPQQIQFTVEPLDLSHLRYSVQQPFYRTNSECLVSDGYNCMFKTDIDLYRQAKEQISKQNNSDIQYLCGINYTSTKFTLNTDTGDFIIGQIILLF